MSCPSCQKDAKFIGYRSKPILHLLGTAAYVRAYYHCSHCHQGYFPTDVEFQLQDHETPAAAEVVSLVGLETAFEGEAALELRKLTGLNLSASSIRRITERIGNDIAQKRAAGQPIGSSESWEWSRDAQGSSVAYVSLDATGVPQQGPHAEARECRMAWVAAVFNVPPGQAQVSRSPQDRASARASHASTQHRGCSGQKTRKSRRICQRRYVSGLMSLEDIGGQLRRECLAVGVAQADVTIGLTDGGAGLEDCLLDHVLGGLARQVVFILDFHHVSDHLEKFARLLLPGNDAARAALTTGWCRQLKSAGGRVVLDEIQEIDLTKASGLIRTEHAKLSHYLSNNLHRMDYPQYVARGWQIGSGVIESACKSIVAHRMKGAGMRWRESGTTSICQLRALFKSDPALWDAYWNPPPD